MLPATQKIDGGKSELFSPRCLKVQQFYFPSPLKIQAKRLHYPSRRLTSRSFPAEKLQRQRRIKRRIKGIHLGDLRDGAWSGSRTYQRPPPPLDIHSNFRKLKLNKLYLLFGLDLSQQNHWQIKRLLKCSALCLIFMHKFIHKRKSHFKIIACQNRSGYF